MYTNSEINNRVLSQFLLYTDGSFYCFNSAVKNAQRAISEILYDLALILRNIFFKNFLLSAAESFSFEFIFLHHSCKACHVCKHDGCQLPYLA